MLNCCRRMKLLILSDSHRRIDRMSLAAEQAKPDAILHLGDHIDDAWELRRRLPGVPFYMVKGNCDINAAGETELLLTLEGVRIFMAHGHAYNVKRGLLDFAYRALEMDAGIALYGHTHKAMMHQVGGIWLMNPGQMERDDKAIPASYGVVTVEGGRLDLELKTLQCRGLPCI